MTARIRQIMRSLAAAFVEHKIRLAHLSPVPALPRESFGHFYEQPQKTLQEIPTNWRNLSEEALSASKLQQPHFIFPHASKPAKAIRFRGRWIAYQSSTVFPRVPTA
jgi:hypothetical protein